MEGLFWLSVLFTGYVYAGYPALLAVWARFAAKPWAQGPDDPLPAVSIVLAARNEAPHLRARIENLLSLDYPADRRQIVVVSDGSTDDTAQVLQAFGDQVERVEIPPSGKAAALNAGVRLARHRVLVFADARQAFAPDALRKLTGPLIDPRVGGVTGQLVLGCETTPVRRSLTDRRSPNVSAIPSGSRAASRRRLAERRLADTSTIGDGIGLYWRYEKAIRRLESAVGSTLGATGCIYALRRALWRPLPPETILDDVLAPMRAVLSGARVVFAEDAIAFDRTSADAATELRRKIRTLAGNVQILGFEPRLLVPFVNPVWPQYFSHKVARLLVPYALVTALGANIALADANVFYALLLAGQCAFYLLGGYGAWLDHKAQAVPVQGRHADRQPVDAWQDTKDVVNA
jgi:cellulose synthase/poly-beta-1,6-N-acetylglucosamine synthase-like glycosyltransferase